MAHTTKTVTVTVTVTVATCEQCRKEIEQPSKTSTITHWDYGFSSKHHVGGLLAKEFSLHWCSADCMTKWYEEHAGQLPIDVNWSR